MFKNMKLGTKIKAALGVNLLFLLLVSAIGYFGLIKVMKAQDDIATNLLPSIQSLLMISVAQSTIDSAEKRGIFSKRPLWHKRAFAWSGLDHHFGHKAFRC